jgi:hypothetical protein
MNTKILELQSYTHDLTPKPMDKTATPMEKYQLGQMIARMYIAAQGVSLVASDAACDALKENNVWMNRGFNEIISTTDYPVRAGVNDPSQG